MSSTKIRTRTRPRRENRSNAPASSALADPLAAHQLADPLCDPLSDPLAAPVQMCEEDDCSDVEILAHHAATAGHDSGPSLIPDLRQPEAADIPASTPEIDPNLIMPFLVSPDRMEDIRGALNRPLVEEMPDPHTVADLEERAEICDQLHPVSEQDASLADGVGAEIARATHPQRGYCAQVLDGNNPAEATILAAAEPFTPSLPVGDLTGLIDEGVDAVIGEGGDINDPEWDVNASGAQGAYSRPGLARPGLSPGDLRNQECFDNRMGELGFALDAISAAGAAAEADACGGSEESRRRVETNRALDQYLEAHPEVRVELNMPADAPPAAQRRILEQHYERIRAEQAEQDRCVIPEDEPMRWTNPR